MTMNQIRYVLMISKSVSMREAAGRLFISQPALTAAINELEDELGIVIFERNNKGVNVTEEGKEFISLAKKALSQFEILEDRYLSKDRSMARFSVSSQHYNFAVHAFASMIKKYDPEKYAFSIHETRTSEVLTNVRDMKSEIGIVSYSDGTKNVLQRILKNYQLEFVPLMKRETYIYVWENHELANEKEISLKQLEAYPCVSFEQDSHHDFYLAEEALANYDFSKMIKSDDRATSMEIIAELGGYSIGSGMLSGEAAILKGLVAIKLKEEDTLTIGYIYRKSSKLSVFGKAYIEELRKYKEIE